MTDWVADGDEQHGADDIGEPVHEHPATDEASAVGAQLQRAALDVIHATRVLLDAVEHAVQDPTLVTSTFSNLVAVGKLAVQALAGASAGPGRGAGREDPARGAGSSGAPPADPGEPTIEHIPLS